MSLNHGTNLNVYKIFILLGIDNLKRKIYKVSSLTKITGEAVCLSFTGLVSMRLDNVNLM